jgi:hypothetical protein
MTGASATRSWLHAQHITWLTPQRMKVATVGLFAAATIASTTTLGGSTTPPSANHPAAAHVNAGAR